jgi:hypothetical protein
LGNRSQKIIKLALEYSIELGCQSIINISFGV